MIGPKRPKLTARQEHAAYDAATVRDSVDGYEQCQKCGAIGPCDRDHRQGRDAYNTTPANLHLLGSSKVRGGCGCHEWKTRNPADALRDGFTVPSWSTPTYWPGWRFGVGWVQYLDELDSDGNWWVEITEEQAMNLMEGQPW